MTSFFWVQAGTPLSYITPAVQISGFLLLLGPPSQHPGDYLRIQYEVNGKAMIDDVAALHFLEFHVRSPPPSTSSTLEPDEQHASVDTVSLPKT